MRQRFSLPSRWQVQRFSLPSRWQVSYLFANFPRSLLAVKEPIWVLWKQTLRWWWACRIFIGISTGTEGKKAGLGRGRRAAMRQAWQNLSQLYREDGGPSVLFHVGPKGRAFSLTYLSLWLWAHEGGQAIGQTALCSWGRPWRGLGYLGYLVLPWRGSG